jgi:hypothetical protein
MDSKNFIARCTWDTSIDNEEYSYHLQQFISQWTQPDLKKLLDRCINDIFPENYHVRIDKLELDLGQIQYSGMNTTLPEKVEEVLRAALKEQMQKLGIDNKTNSEQNESTTVRKSSLGSEGSHGDKAATDWFIEHGAAPWWYRTGDSICDALNQQLAASANFIQDITTKIRGRDTIRKRVLWQWGEQGCRHIVEHLEPLHAAKVESLINVLCLTNKQFKIFQIDSSGLSEFLWLIVAEYLLRNRAASFNMQGLSQILLLSLSEKYHKSHDDMVNLLITSSSDTEQSNVLRSAFLKEIPIDPWLDVILPNSTGKGKTELALMAELLLKMKSVIQVHYPIDPKESEVVLQELFSKLAINQPRKLIQLLKKAGKETSVRRHLLNELDHQHRVVFVNLLAPNDSAFICTHVRRTQIVVTEQKKDAEIVWDIVFAYLLQDSGTHFNRVQFVKQTLEKTGREHSISYYQILQLLLHSVVINAGFEQRIELIEIIERLHKEEKGRQVKSNKIAIPVEHIFKTYLLSGKVEAVFSDHEESINNVGPKYDELIGFINNEPIQVFKLLKQCLIQGANQKNLGVFKHLINLIGAGGFRQWVNTQIIAFLPKLQNVSLQLEHWHKYACLRSLNSTDVVTALYRSSLETLVFHQSELSEKSILIFWINRLASITGSNTRELIEQIQFCIDRKSYLLNQYDSEDFSPIFNNDEVVSNVIESAASDRDLLKQLHNELADINYWSYSKKVVAIRCALKLSAKNDDSIRASQQILTELMDVVSTKEWENIINSLFEESYDTAALQGLMKHKELKPINRWLKSISLNKKNLLDDVVNDLRIKNIAISSSDRETLEVLYWQCLVNEKYTSHSRPSNISVDNIFYELSARHFNMNITKHENKPKGSSEASIQNKTKQLEQVELFQLSLNGKPPEWLKSTPTVSLRRRLDEQINENPKQFIQLLIHIGSRQDALFRVYSNADLTQVINTLEREISTWKIVLVELLVLLNTVKYSAIYNGNLPDLKIQLVNILLSSWVEHEKGNALSAKNIAERLQSTVRPIINEVIDQKTLSQLPILGKTNVFQLESNSTPKPVAKSVANVKTEVTAINNPIEVERMIADQYVSKAIDLPVKNQISDNQIIEVNNAGLVLLQNYFTMYLERLELLDNNDKSKFKDLESQYKAVHCLQYLVTGMTDTEEHYLLLNKMICNLPFNHPIPRSYYLSDADKKIGQGLIEAMIDYWPECGSNTIDGFRGNWLVRDGILKEQDDQWELIVSKRSYDIMLNRSPFSYSIIRLPWMSKPIYVSWHV